MILKIGVEIKHTTKPKRFIGKNTCWFCEEVFEIGDEKDEFSCQKLIAI